MPIIKMRYYIADVGTIDELLAGWLAMWMITNGASVQRWSGRTVKPVIQLGQAQTEARRW